MPTSGEHNQPASRYPRTVRDGSLAAAIGVAVALALQCEADTLVETPWEVSARIHMNTIRSGRPLRAGWGKHAGWNPVDGKWRFRTR